MQHKTFNFPELGWIPQLQKLTTLWVRVHHSAVIFGVRSSSPTAVMGLLLSETQLKISFALLATLHKNSTISLHLQSIYGVLTPLFHVQIMISNDYVSPVDGVV